MGVLVWRYDSQLDAPMFESGPPASMPRYSAMFKHWGLKNLRWMPIINYRRTWSDTLHESIPRRLCVLVSKLFVDVTSPPAAHELPKIYQPPRLLRVKILWCKNQHTYRAKVFADPLRMMEQVCRNATLWIQTVASINASQTPIVLQLKYLQNQINHAIQSIWK